MPGDEGRNWEKTTRGGQRIGHAANRGVDDDHAVEHVDRRAVAGWDHAIEAAVGEQRDVEVLHLGVDRRGRGCAHEGVDLLALAPKHSWLRGWDGGAARRRCEDRSGDSMRRVLEGNLQVMPDRILGARRQPSSLIWWSARQ